MFLKSSCWHWCLTSIFMKCVCNIEFVHSLRPCNGTLHHFELFSTYREGKRWLKIKNICAKLMITVLKIVMIKHFLDIWDTSGDVLCFLFCFFRLKIIAPMDTIRDLQTNCLSQFSHKWLMQCVVQPVRLVRRVGLDLRNFLWLGSKPWGNAWYLFVLNHRSAAGTKEGLSFRFSPQGRGVSHLTQPLCRVAVGGLRSILQFHWRTIMILMDEYLYICIHLSCSFYFVVKFDFPNAVWTQQLLYEPVAFKIIKVVILYNSSRGWRCLHPNCQVAFLIELFPHWAEKELTVSMSRWLLRL